MPQALSIRLSRVCLRANLDILELLLKPVATEVSSQGEQQYSTHLLPRSPSRIIIMAQGEIKKTKGPGAKAS